MLRQDKTANVTELRSLFRRTYWFEAKAVPRMRLPKDEAARLMEERHSRPVKVAGSGERVWWWFERSFYWEDEGYSAGDVLALVRDRERRKKRQLNRAKDLLVAESSGTARREPITSDVRRAVYTRDGGACVQCGSTFDIQYDHILPVARGGATTIENLQVLCSDCNRRKADSI